MRYPLESARQCARKGAAPARANAPEPLDITALAKEATMPDGATTAPAVAESTARTPNMGQEPEDFNDNWRPIGALAAALVADQCAQIALRDPSGARGVWRTAYGARRTA